MSIFFLSILFFPFSLFVLVKFFIFFIFFPKITYNPRRNSIDGNYLSIQMRQKSLNVVFLRFNGKLF